MSNKLEDFDDKAHQLAAVINMMKPAFHLMDLEYAKQAVQHMHDTSAFLDSAAVLNPMYNPLRQQIIRKQATALGMLIKVIEELKEVDKMKDDLSSQEANQQDIMNFFK